MQGYMKGQVTLINLLALAMSLVMLSILMPVLIQPTIDNTVNCLQGGTGIPPQTCPDPPLVPNAQTPVVIVLIQLAPAFLFISLIVTGLIYAIPRREGG